MLLHECLLKKIDSKTLQTKEGERGMDRKEYQKRYKKLNACFLVCLLLLVPGFVVLLFWARSAGIIAYILNLLFIVCCILLAVYFCRKIDELKSPDIKNALSEHFEIEQYQPHGHVAWELVRASHLFVSFSALHSSGSNLIVGRYRGVRFSYSDLALSRGRYSKTGYVAFCVLEHQGMINGKILIKEYEEEPGNRKQPDPGRERDKTVSGKFYREFKVQAKNQESVSRVLTPSFMKSILQMIKTGLRMDICVDENRVYIVVWNRKSLFQTDDKTGTDINTISREGACRLSDFLDVFLDHPELFSEAASSELNHK